MKLFLYFIFFVLVVITSCSTSSVKENLEKAGDAAGQTAGKLAKGIQSGMNKTFDVKVELPEQLAKQGITLGKTIVSSDKEGTDNLLSVYFIFSENYKGSITAKVFDAQLQEMGRAIQPVEAVKGEAKFIDFHFDKRTNIDSDSKLTLEPSAGIEKQK